MSFFGIDNPFARTVNKLVQLIYAGLLWFVCSIPIVTVGAATAALYEVLLKMAKDREGSIGESFFRGFRNNLKCATLVWLPILLAELVFGFNLFYYAVLGGGSFPVQSLVFGLLLLVTVTVFGFVFPILAKFENTTAGTFRMAFLLAIRNPGWTLAIAFLQVLTILICYTFLYFPTLFIAGLLGYPQAAIFNRIFDRLIAEGKITEVCGSEEEI